MIENNYRSDIKFVTNDYRLANLIRMMNYEKIKYCILNNKIYNDDNKEIIIDDTEYDFIDSIYKNKLPLWETPTKNARKYPDLYNDSKWIIGKREQKRVHNKLLIFENGFKLKIGYLWKHQPFNQRPTYKNKFVKMFYLYDNENKLILENENWGAILSQTQQYIKDNAKQFYDEYKKVTIKGYCKSEDVEFTIVKYDILENYWYSY